MSDQLSLFDESIDKEKIKREAYFLIALEIGRMGSFIQFEDNTPQEVIDIFKEVLGEVSKEFVARSTGKGKE